jgi:hypothetical protein
MFISYNLILNIRLESKCLTGINALAYLASFLVMRTFLFVTDTLDKLARAFSL